MMQCVAEGHDLVALANLRPKQKDQVSPSPDELDSYMYQTVGHHAIELYAEALGLPLYRGFIEGSSREQGRDYSPTEGDEVEDLHKLLKKVKNDLGVEGVSVGAILSNYQRVRVENVCSRLGLTPLAFLWRRDQEELLEEMITAGVEAIIIKVAALGLTSSHLGKTLLEIQPHMMNMQEKYQLNVCGEGGEFESFTLDCPLFAKKMKVKHYEVVNHSDDAFAPVYYLNLLRMELDEKQNVGATFADRLRHIPMKRGTNILQELEDCMVQESPEARLLTSEDDTSRQDTNSAPFINRLSPICKISTEGYMWISGITTVFSDILTIAEGTKQAMESLKELLGNHGYNLSDAVMVHLYVTDMSHFPQVNSVYCRYFQQNPPSRVCIQVDLPCDTTLQVDCLAHKKPQSSSHDEITTALVPRHTMHVQSISHWAPANIGPYSQAVQIGNFIFSAGMLSLCPSTMRTIEGGIIPQCALSLRSLQRVLAAMQSGLSLSDVVSGVCYVTDVQQLSIVRKHWEKFVCGSEEHSCTDLARDMMCYVVVRRLPKDVRVEWHVVASVGSEFWQYSNQTQRGQVSSTELRLILNSGKSTGFLMCHVTPYPNPEPELIVRDFITAVVAQLKEQMYSWDNTLCMRVFYRRSLAGHRQLLNALTTEFKKATSTCPAVCLVPVLSLPESCVITALIFLQR